VLVLERNERPGGCIRSDDAITRPGFIHDLLSGFYPLFTTSPAYALLGADLHRHGLEFVHGGMPTGVLLPDLRYLTLAMSRSENVTAFDRLQPGDGARYRESMEFIEQHAELVFGLLNREPWRLGTARLIAGKLCRSGPFALSRYFGQAMQSCDQWLSSSFEAESVRALLAPWILHTGLAPGAVMSGLMARLIAFTLEHAGMPVVKGGSVRLVHAFVDLLTENGASLECGTDVSEILVRDGRARGIRTQDGREYAARDAILCNVTPTQLYERLLSREHVPSDVIAEARAFRHGRGDMQIHLALDRPPAWPVPELRGVTMMHVTGGPNAVARAVSEAERGLLPADATIVVAQPAAADPSRTPEGKWILWIQLQELPRVVRGDALEQIAVPGDGRWTDDLKRRYADRIVARLDTLLPGLRDSILAQAVLSPADLETININLVGGDPYGGDCALDQFFLWRPLKSLKNHNTPVKGLYHIGASTHPGPGLAGGSGCMVAQSLLGSSFRH
jgi:phytoene dehydrogenase-like protein